MSRRLRLALVVLVILALLGGAVLLALPEIVRQVALTRIPELTGRKVSIADVDLNLFTGRVALKSFRLFERDSSDAFVQFDRLDLRVSPLSIVGGNIRVVDLTLTGPSLRIVRTGPADFNFSDLLALVPPADPSKPPSRWTVSVERLALVEGGVVISDRALSPAREWRVQGLGFEASALHSAPGQPPGRLVLRARVNESPVEVRADDVRLTPAGFAAQISLDRFDLSQVRPYLPAALPATVENGTLGVALRIGIERSKEGFKTLLVSGDVQIDSMAVKQAERDAPFLNVARFKVGIKEADVLSRSVTLSVVEIDGLDLRAVRSRTGEIDLMGLLARPPAETPATPAAPATPTSGPAVSASPSTPPPKARVERLIVKSGTVTLRDESLPDAREWKIQGLTVEGAALGIGSSDAGGTLKLATDILPRPNARPTKLTVDASSVRLSPVGATARVVLDGLELADLGPYLPDALPALPRAGSVGFTLDVAGEVGDGGLKRATASGSVRLVSAAVVQRGATAPFFTVPKVVVSIKQADVVTRSVHLASIDVEGMNVRAVRDRSGAIDLLALTATPAAPAAPAPAPAVSASPPPAARGAPPSAAPPWRLRLDRLTLSKGDIVVEDHAVSPAAMLKLGDMKLTAERVSWPLTSPATFTLLVSMPGGGWSHVKGTAVLEPLNVQIAISTRDTSITPYQTYLPFGARLAGLFNGDSVSEIQRGPKQELILASRGTAWANEIEVRAPDAKDPVVRMDSLVIADIDFSWPNYALVKRVTFAHPQALLEREADGQINLRTLFTVPQSADHAPTPAPTLPPSGQPTATSGPSGQPAATSPPSGQPADTTEGRGGLMQNMVIDFTEIAIENAFAHFVDRTMSPPFSEDISRLTLKIRDLSNVPGRSARTTMTAQGLVGVDGVLDMRGDLSGLGETLRADLVAELRDFSLATANPYAENLTSWNIQSGTLQAKIHYHVEGDRITAEHDVALKKLRVGKARETDEAKRRIGIPLGLAVALLKDSQGNIDLSVPLTGSLTDRSFNWGEAIWGAVKQVIGKVLLSPFRAIGRLFTGSDDSVDKLEINPITFGPGSAVVAPSLEPQLTKLAEFLQRSPAIKVALAPVVTAADVQSLKEQQVSARLEAFRREERLPDLAAALRAYYQRNVPDAVVPKTVEEQLALLVQREPVPDAALTDLVARRLEAVREDLVKARNIAAERVQVPAASAGRVTPATSGEGRVEFNIVTDSG